jgi:hypothetical protein
VKTVKNSGKLVKAGRQTPTVDARPRSLLTYTWSTLPVTFSRVQGKPIPARGPWNAYLLVRLHPASRSICACLIRVHIVPGPINGGPFQSSAASLALTPNPFHEVCLNRFTIDHRIIQPGVSTATILQTWLDIFETTRTGTSR